MTLRPVFAWMVGAVLYAAARPAAASEPVIVTPAVVEGELSGGVRERIEARLVQVVGKSNLSLVEIDAATADAALECRDDRCRAHLLSSHGAEFLLVPSITLVDEDYQLALTLYGPSGAESARLEETCNLCGMAEAADLMADLGARIGRKVEVAARASAITVRSDPPGASVWIGDSLVGTTPVELPLDAGTHALRIELDGYIGLERSVDVVAGEANTVDLDLQPVPVEADGESESKRSKTMIGLGAGSLAFGLGALAGGATLLVLDERPITSDCSGANVDPMGNCRWRYSTLEAGIGLAAGGVALVATGIALLVVGRKQRAKDPATTSRLRVSPTLGGVALQF